MSKDGDKTPVNYSCIVSRSSYKFPSMKTLYNFRTTEKDKRRFYNIYKKNYVMPNHTMLVLLLNALSDIYKHNRNLSTSKHL